jgi:hypothetical protein
MKSLDERIEDKRKQLENIDRIVKEMKMRKLKIGAQLDRLRIAQIDAQVSEAQRNVSE